MQKRRRPLVLNRKLATIIIMSSSSSSSSRLLTTYNRLAVEYTEREREKEAKIIAEVDRKIRADIGAGRVESIWGAAVPARVKLHFENEGLTVKAAEETVQQQEESCATTFSGWKFE